MYRFVRRRNILCIFNKKYPQEIILFGKIYMNSLEGGCVWNWCEKRIRKEKHNTTRTGRKLSKDFSKTTAGFWHSAIPRYPFTSVCNWGQCLCPQNHWGPTFCITVNNTWNEVYCIFNRLVPITNYLHI